ncbi:MULTISPECIES: DUF4225 domain-containing protein [unclassified Pseudomonas]|uniref:DUF4225 domain-containing protein n=1 Tax=unclassified Pseudomonas TaxID=196821 RepID=UPI001B318CD9|nr:MULTISPECIES: DUF4225 domain-containing protein [unclassified Pseudomonas]MBP5946893.1 DUF4225 domain-containing protein [Pseudomonas sp. P9(2020)]MBZ9565031.1 DUF4225 domain-containing protein [Pseudomonas sp. P116]
MGRSKDSCKSGSCDYWMVSNAAANLTNQACTLSARHIKDGTLRIQFNREVSYYARGVVNDVAQGRKSSEQGLKDIKDEQNSLLSQSMEVAQRGVGAIAGALQFVAGAGICYGSVGTLCLFAGAPMMAHGANNVYENGRNLWEGRSDTQGPVRKVYQEVAKIIGGGAFEGNMAYGTVDLGLSVYGAGRLILKPDGWRLFRYVHGDYVRGYQNSSKAALMLEAASNTITIETMYRQVTDND